MAQESSSAQISRLDGVSRIPLPRSQRPSNIPINIGKVDTQIGRPILSNIQRPTSFAGLRPPISKEGNHLKKSSSGERLNNPINGVSKKTTTALKMLLSKPDKLPSLNQPSQTRKPLQFNGKKHINAVAPPKFMVPQNTQINETVTLENNSSGETDVQKSQLFTRSSTFVRGENNNDFTVLVQSTPASRSIPVSTPYFETPGFNDVTTTILPNLSETVTINNIQFSSNTANQLGQVHNSTHVVNSTMYFVSPEQEKLTNIKSTLGGCDSMIFGKTLTLTPKNLSNAINGTEIEDRSKLIFETPSLLKGGEKPADMSPIANATYCNSGPDKNLNTDATYCNLDPITNLINLDDVSMPSGLEDMDTTLQASNISIRDDNNDELPVTKPNKKQMKLALNSTMNTERLLDLTQNIISPTRQFNNQTHDLMCSPRSGIPTKNTSKLLYMSHFSNATTPDRPQKCAKMSITPRPVSGYRNTPLPLNLRSPMLLKGAQSDLVLPTCTPDDDRQVEPMNVDSTLCSLAARTEEFYNAQVQQNKCGAQAISLQDINNPNEKQKARYSFGLDLTESTLDCSIELIDISLSSTGLSQPNCTMNSVNRNFTNNNNIAQSASLQQLQHQQQQQQQQNQNQMQQYLLKKQNSFEMDESLGILTPDQMKEFLDSNATNNTNNLDLPLDMNSSNNNNHNNNKNKISFHQMRMEQTPSPEELPLDPVEVKTDISDFLSQQQQNLNVLQQRHLMAQQQTHHDSLSQQTETDLSKNDQMIKSNVSKISTSFITSVTSVTSLDTGYQGDGEMSRPASRGASDHSPSNGPRKVGPVSRQPSFNQVHAMPPTIRRQDLMTDSDFFTESDADELHHRGGDRRAQVIDGQLYGQTGASLFISEDPQMEDSCMESSGIFTDVENRCEEDLAVMRCSQQATQELSPDGEADNSTETVKSYRAKQKRALADSVYEQANNSLGQGQIADRKINSQTSPLLLSSYSSERLSADTTLSNRTSYCSIDGASSAVNKSYSSLEEKALNLDDEKTKQSTKSATTTGTKSLCGDHNNFRTPATVDIIISPRKHASLTSLTNENALIAYVAKKIAVKSTSGTAIFPHVNGSCVDSQTVSVNGSGSSSKVSLQREKSPSTRTPKTVNKSVKNQIATTPKSAENVSSTRKSHAPNKWDAVMNKIATNKATQVRKNYTDVKSKVSTRNVLAIKGVNSSGVSVDGSTPVSSVASPRMRRSPSSASPNVLKVLQTNSPKLSEFNLSGNGNSLQTICSKRPLLQSATKRARSYSKDSQKSDLSPGSGSPKLLPKTLIRAAKKRDVRNLSISPTDLGPPPKAQQTTNGTATRSKTNVTATHTQKRITVSPPTITRISHATASAPTATGLTKNGIVENRKSSPILKIQNNNINNIRQTTLKDQSRLLGSTQTINSAATIIKNVSKVTAVSQLHDQNVNNNNNNNNNNIINNMQTATVLADKLRTCSQRSSPLLGQQHNHAKKIVPTTAGAATTEKKIQMKLPVSRKFNLQKQNGGLTPTETKTFSTTSPSTPATNGSGNEYLDADELQRLKYLNRHSFNGVRDYELLKLHLQHVEEAKQHQEKGVLALGILVKYMVYELDAFSCPATKLENEKFKIKMQKVLAQLQDVQNNYLELQNQLCDKENYYATREEELQALHRCELEKSKENALKFEEKTKKEISELEAQLIAKDEQHKTKMNDYQFEMQLKFSEKDQQLLAASERLKILTEDHKSLTERLEAAEMKHKQEMTAVIEREFAQNQRIDQLKKELEILRESKQHRERELRDKLNLSQDEIALLRCSPTNSGDGGPAMRHSSASCGSTPKSSVSHNELSRLQSEAESLRCVLEIKQKEVSKLNKQNEELLRDAEECSVLRSKIYSLETTKEMLQSEVKIKTVKEKEYLRQINDMQKNLKHETQRHTRLLYDNEALTWQLKQRSELLHHLEIKLQESLKDSSFNLDVFSLCGKSSLNHNSTSASENSPPPSPITKGVIEKKDSVAWVLEMDDETPEEAATKLVRRVGSFRSPIQRGSISTSGATNNSSSMSRENKSTGPHRLSQSMSAASVIRKHSYEPTNNQKVRSRSYSVSGSNSSESTVVAAKPNKNGKKLSRQNTVGPSQYLETTSGMEGPISASSPYAGMRPRSSTLISAKNNQDSMSFLQNKTDKALTTNRKLITCDTSALNSGERLKLRALPKSAVHGLKSRKKCLEIQESAGEAMVSGANSEDEGCSASSDEIASSVSMGSATSSSSTSLNQLKNSNMSLEEVLLMENINNLSSTPMECSWSDDAESYADNHKV